MASLKLCNEKITCKKSASNLIQAHLDKHLTSAKTSSEIHQAIYNAFDDFENEIYDKLKNAFEIGFPKAPNIGSCAIVSIVYGNKLYVANSGDCEGVLLRKRADGTLESIKICKAFSANNPEEQARLKAEFPNEPDVIM